MNVEAIAFDLDGTIYLGNNLIDGVLEVLAYLKSKKIKSFFFTNNSAKTREEIFNKLIRLGVTTTIKNVYCASFALIEYLKENNLHHPFFIASQSIISEANNFGIKHTVSETNADCVAVCLDQDITYDKISIASNILNRGKRFIACNIDRNYPVENNRILPGCGAIVSAIEFCSNKKLNFMVGKPNTYMLDLLIKNEKLNKNNLLLIGDSFDSDIQMAINADIKSVLISNSTDNYGNAITANNMFEVLSFLKKKERAI